MAVARKVRVLQEGCVNMPHKLMRPPAGAGGLISFGWRQQRPTYRPAVYVVHGDQLVPSLDRMMADLALPYAS